MPLYDWLNKFRRPRVVARENIRTRRREYIQFPGPIAAIESTEDRLLLSPTVILMGGGLTPEGEPGCSTLHAVFRRHALPAFDRASHNPVDHHWNRSESCRCR